MERNPRLLEILKSGRYLVSPSGVICDRTVPAIRQPTVDADGHLVVNLSECGVVRVGRLVALWFHGLPPEDAPLVAYRNGDCLDLRAENIFWSSAADVSRRSHQAGLIPHPVGESLPHSKLNATLVNAIRGELAHGMPIRKVAALFEVSRGAVNGIKQRKSWRHVP